MNGTDAIGNNQRVEVTYDTSEGPVRLYAWLSAETGDLIINLGTEPDSNDLAVRFYIDGVQMHHDHVKDEEG